MFNISAQKYGLIKFLLDGIRQFESDNPNAEWSCVAFDCCPRMGWVALNFDTSENSSSIVSRFQHNGPDWYGEDDLGRFSNNCADFKYCEYTRFDIPEWYETYNALEDDLSIRCIAFDGNENIVNVEVDGDEGLNNIVFLLLKNIMTENKQEIIRIAKRREEVSRFGIQMSDSEFVYFEAL